MNFENFWKRAEKDIIFHNDKLNVIESCIDRHLISQPNKLAFVFETENGKQKNYTYEQLNSEVNKFANFLKNKKVNKNSRIFIFLPKIPEHYISFLGSIKHGSIPVPLFEAFQTEGLELRLEKGNANVLITNKELFQRLKNKKKFKNIKIIIIDSNDFKNKIKNCSNQFETVLKNKKDTCLMIFTSSTAGTPIAGIELPHQGLIQQHFTGKFILKLNKEDNYWCTAHPGWVTGSVYGILVPLSIGCTTYIYEGHFNSEKWLNFMKKNNISVIYTAPTVLKMFQENIKKKDLENIKNLCSVGEALPKSTFNFYKKIGIKICDTYWQTETGAIVIAGYINRKPGSIGKAIPGIQVKILNGTIAIKKTWPAMMTGIYKHNKMYRSYFKNEWFITNDLAIKDKHGFFYFISRKDDIIKTSGERVSPIEIESELMKHKAVKEIAVIGIPDKIKGQIIKAFIVLKKEFNESELLKQEISNFIKKNYAGHAYPKEIQFIKNLPKTNSGKIIRMKLREII